MLSLAAHNKDCRVWCSEQAYHLITSYMDVLAGEQADDLLQDAFQELKSGLLAGTVHILVHPPMHRHFRHITYTAQAQLECTILTTQEIWTGALGPMRCSRIAEKLVY